MPEHTVHKMTFKPLLTEAMATLTASAGPRAVGPVYTIERTSFTCLTTRIAEHSYGS